jgi:hypothetical protein
VLGVHLSLFLLRLLFFIIRWVVVVSFAHYSVVFWFLFRCTCTVALEFICTIVLVVVSVVCITFEVTSSQLHMLSHIPPYRTRVDTVLFFDPHTACASIMAICASTGPQSHYPGQTLRDHVYGGWTVLELRSSRCFLKIEDRSHWLNVHRRPLY